MNSATTTPITKHSPAQPLTLEERVEKLEKMQYRMGRAMLVVASCWFLFETGGPYLSSFVRMLY